MKKGPQMMMLLVAIGPSISKKNYLVDNKTLCKFYKQIAQKELKKLKRRKVF